MLTRLTDELIEYAKRSNRTVTIPLRDYLELLLAAEADDSVVHCEICGAWLSSDDEARCTVDDISGCWKSVSDRRSDQALCRSHRGLILEEANAAMMAARADR
jgi:hypothetical protein